MAKNTGAVEYTDFGLDVTAATLSNSCYSYMIIPVPVQPQATVALGRSNKIQKPKISRRITVGTDTTLEEIWNIGSNGTFSDTTAGASASAWETDETSTHTTHQARFFLAYSGSLLEAPRYWRIEMEAYCTSSGTGPNTTEIEALWLETVNDSTPIFSPYCDTPKSTASDRVYAAYESISAYDVQRLLVSSLDAMIVLCRPATCWPLFGTFV